MKRTSTLLVALAFSIGLSSSMALAHGPGGPQGPCDMGLPMVLHTLNLTAGQRAQIHKIMRSQQATLKTLFEQRREGRQKLEAELFSPGPVTMANLTPFEQNNAQIDQQIHRTFLQIALQIRGVLTQAQISRGATTLARMQQLQNEMHSLYALDDNFPPAPEGK